MGLFKPHAVWPGQCPRVLAESSDEGRVAVCWWCWWWRVFCTLPAPPRKVMSMQSGADWRSLLWREHGPCVALINCRPCSLCSIVQHRAASGPASHTDSAPSGVVPCGASSGNQTDAGTEASAIVVLTSVYRLGVVH